MKKLLCLLLSLLMITGCSSGDNEYTVMIMNSDEEYVLYDKEGERLTEVAFKAYEENYNRGYLVTNAEDKKAYINDNGEFIVDFDEYDTIAYADEMVMTTKVVETEEGVKTNTADKEKKTNKVDVTTTNNTSITKDNGFVIDKEGKVIFSTSDTDTLKISGLPIINQGGNWKVLYKNGEELYNDTQEVYYALHDDTYLMYLVALKDKLYVYYGEEELSSLAVEITGNFKISDSIEQGCLLYDQAQKVLVYIDFENSESYTYNNITATSIYFDESKNIIVENGTAISLVSSTVSSLKTVNSYYKDINNYVLRSNSIYGPHSLYVEGKLTTTINDCQVFPDAVKLEGNYFPVYVRDTGFQYYDLNGKQPFTATFYDAEAFDKNNRAIVKDALNSTYLINELGVMITTNYYNVEYIGSSYYAVYNESGQFGIIDKDANEILPIGYTTLPDQCIFYYNGNEYLMVEKYGRTYVYNCSKEFEEVFSQEGNTIFNEKGYYVVNGENYYTFEGKLIH